jgi:uncharacterized protein YodC (DUF2158 family)
MKAKEGDVVRIKSGGGPFMTVGCRIGDAHWVSWWDEEKKTFRVDMFYLSQLEPIDTKTNSE